MALIPLIWCVAQGETRAEWWWLGIAFGISWLADTASHWMDPVVISTVYPVGQSAILGAVLLDRHAARVWVLGLMTLALMAIELEHFAPDRLLRTIAWLGIVTMIWDRPLGRCWHVLVMAYGVGWAAWMAYTFWPGWTIWSTYQGIRAVSIGMFCWASRRRVVA